MFEFINDPEERGQVGIGTLIVFIAMVLVAAIAAGVLINTAGFLQTKSEATGQEASSQVSNRVTVVSAYGDVSTADEGNDSVTNGTVHYVNLTVMRSAGSANINLSRATIEWIGPVNAVTLTNGPNVAADTNDTQFATVAVKGDDPQVLTDQDSRIKLVLNATSIRNDGPTFDGGVTKYDGLREGENVKLTITTQYGATTSYWVSVPESLQGKQAVTL
mgnify:CR=1 FL=1